MPSKKEMSRKTKELRDKRNAKIMERYLWWTEKQRLRFDDTIRRLSEVEFFLSEDYIISIVKKEMARLSAEGAPVPHQKYLSVNL